MFNLGKLLLVSSGGILTPRDAINRILNGATFVQLFTKIILDVNLRNLLEIRDPIAWLDL
jgi:dihydroorotate dehydrogenase